MNIFTCTFVVIYYWFYEFFLFFIPKRFRQKSVQNEIALITGGGGGLGRELALQMVKKGAKVVLWDISENGLNASVEAVKSAGGECWAYLCDITNRELVYETAKKVRSEVGIVTILFNNAGIFTGKELLDIPDNMIIKTFQVNTFSHFWTCKAFLPDMMKANRGHIITIASIAGLTGFQRLSDYCGSKFANVGFEESLRFELENGGFSGIHTTLVCLYFMDTPLFDGVKIPSFLSLLKARDVAQYVVLAMLANTQYVLLPKIAHFLFLVKSALPTRCFNIIVNDLMNMSEALKGIEERQSKQKKLENLQEIVITKL